MWISLWQYFQARLLLENSKEVSIMKKELRTALPLSMTTGYWQLVDQKPIFNPVGLPKSLHEQSGILSPMTAFYRSLPTRKDGPMHGAMYCGYASLCKARTLLVELHLPQRERPFVGKATRDLGRIPKWRVQGSQFAMTYFDMSSQKIANSFEPHQEFLMQPAANSIPKEFDYVLTGLVHSLTILLAIHYHDLTIVVH